MSKDTDAARYSDTIKFKHHTLATPSVSAVDRIVKATKHLQDVIQGQNDTSPDELEAIEALKALISDTPPTVHPQETENESIGGKEALLVPSQQYHEVAIEAAPSHTGEEDPNGQQYNIISPEKDVGRLEGRVIMRHNVGDWDHKKMQVDLSMPTYIQHTLTKYQHPPPSKPQHAPYQAAPVQYGAKDQMVATTESPPWPRSRSSTSKMWWAHCCTLGGR